MCNALTLQRLRSVSSVVMANDLSKPQKFRSVYFESVPSKEGAWILQCVIITDSL
jgi:hypothetical protein